MIYAGLAVALGGLGVGCLYRSWSTASTRGLMLTGWLLLLLSLICWIVASGAEFGVSLAMLIIPVIAWLAMLFTADIRPQRTASLTTGKLAMPRMKTLGRHMLLFVLSVPFAAIAATFISVAFAKLLPWSNINASVLAILLMPLLWGIGAYWICADSRKTRPMLWLIGLGGLSAAFIYV